MRQEASFKLLVFEIRYLSILHESRMINIIEDIIPAGRPNRPGRKVELQKITIHNTANTAKTADAKAHSKYLINTNDKKSWHFTCDDKSIFQHLPTNEIGYHAKSGNSKTLGIEICQNEGIDQSAADDNAAMLTAKLLDKHNLNLDDVVTHKYWTGKICPRLLLNGVSEGAKWQTFLEKVKGFQDSKGYLLMEGLVLPEKSNLPAALDSDDLIDLDHSSIVLS